MKILAPAGNFESLRQAVYNGADEVYLGINDFNARNNIDGFTLENLELAVDFCHLYNVKVCLAINILFSDDELFSALNTALKAYSFGVDYFIVQDLGLASLLKKFAPKIILHASTQMGIHNLEGVLSILPYGFSRVVLARETPLEEINRIRKNTNVEIEYFAHGALCVSFSGNCYLSSYLNNASGNRGKCKQLCRLPFTLEKNGKVLKQGYLLSAKDFDLSENLKTLEDAGVDVIKIEGRARRSFYVAVTTRQYKNALIKNKTDKELLALAFNRGFTNAYFDGNGKIISSFQNHIGLNVGKIIKVKNGKTFNEVIFTSNRELSPKSTFKIFNNGKERLTLTAYDLSKINNSEYRLTTTQKVSCGDWINLIVDDKLEKEILESSLKRKVDLKFFLKENCPIACTFNFDSKEYSFNGDTLSPAKTIFITKEEITDCFNKHEIFNANCNITRLDKVFLTKKQLNGFRREVYDNIYEIITSKFKRSFVEVNNHDIIALGASSPFVDFYICYKNTEALGSIKQKNIIYSPEIYDEKDIIDFSAKCSSHNKKLYLDLPNFSLKKDIELFKAILENNNIPFIVNNYYALNFSGEKVIGGGLNIYNSITASLFNAPYITAERDLGSKTDFFYMTLRHCPYKNHLGVDCKNCPHEEGYYLKMQSGKKLNIKRKKLSTCTFYLQ